MDVNNIPSSLMKGVSKEDFEMRLEGLRVAILEDCINSLNSYNEMIEEIRSNDSTEKTEEWINELQKQVEESIVVIKKKYENIDNMFNRIFNDWNEYKLEHPEIFPIEETESEERKDDEAKEEVEEKTTEETTKKTDTKLEEKIEVVEEVKDKEEKTTEGDTNE